jgi:hypothetical protein
MHYASSPTREDLAVWPYTDLNYARFSGANVLLVGAETQVVDFVSLLVPDLNEEKTIRPNRTPLQLPPTSSHIGQVVVWDVGALTLQGQQELLEWLDQVKGRTQVISIATAPLFVRVETGAFDSTLYYRLNTIFIDLSQ